MLVDTHAHFASVEQARTQVDEAKNQGVGLVIAVASDLASSKTALEIANSVTGIEASVGIHPHEASKDQGKISEIEELATENEVVAIGECGLDYHYMHSPKETQKQVFLSQIGIAKQLNKPLIVHSRESMKDVLAILRNEDIPEAGCVLHCFSGDLNQAQEAISLGCYLAFGGTITFKNSSAAEVATQVPLSKIVLETDSPYLTPEPYRGKPNKPSYLPLIAHRLAKLKKIDFDQVCSKTTANANKLFSLET